MVRAGNGFDRREEMMRTLAAALLLVSSVAPAQEFPPSSPGPWFLQEIIVVVADSNAPASTIPGSIKPAKASTFPTTVAVVPVIQVLEFATKEACEFARSLLAAESFGIDFPLGTGGGGFGHLGAVISPHCFPR